VVIDELDENQGQKVAEEISKHGTEILFVKTDVTDYKQVEKMVKKAPNDLVRWIFW